jgi:ATP-binding cassette, subfamily C (CFTR/MRP), member 1
MCALLPDLQVLPAGDQTEIGERGINLSGGQKARVGLARAVYADAEVVLLDDPLAAVDAHVGQHLFENCITPLVNANKCVVLVTNALQFIRDAHDIVVLDNGSIIEHGTYSQLLELGGAFHDMMMAHAEGMATADDARTRESGTDESLVLIDLEPAEKARAASIDSKPAASQKQAAQTGTAEASKAPKGQLIANEDREVCLSWLSIHLPSSQHHRWGVSRWKFTRVGR